jgi:hypothetical protein
VAGGTQLARGVHPAPVRGHPALRGRTSSGGRRRGRTEPQRDRLTRSSRLQGVSRTGCDRTRSRAPWRSRRSEQSNG